MALAKWLEKFWHDQGSLAAGFWAELIGERFAMVDTYEIHLVESTLVNGMPPALPGLGSPAVPGAPKCWGKGQKSTHGKEPDSPKMPSPAAGFSHPL